MAGTISQERVDAIVQCIREGGGKIVTLLKQGLAFYATFAPSECRPVIVNPAG